MKVLLPALAALAAGAAPLAAQSDGPLRIPRLTGPVVLDGRPDEAAWSAVQPLPVVMFQPTFGGEPTERTEIRIAYDDTHLYASCRCFDAEPSGIRGNSLYRDRYSGDDVFAVLLDSFNDRENAMWFWTTPTGVRMDYLISRDGEGGHRTFNRDWNAFWDVVTVSTEEGWFAEMRIPFSSLRFQVRDGQVVMGLITYRYISRKGERALFPAMSPAVSNAPFRPSQARQVVIDGVGPPRRPVYVTPYALGGVDRLAKLNGAGTAYQAASDETAEAGLDLKYGLTSNLTLDLSVNTDFAQVEADDQQINLTRFSLFFPEKRQFFQERSGIFSFDLGEDHRFFHSRRIGLDAAGRPVRIWGGARLVGRVGSWDLGFLDMQTAREGGLPAENFGVLRVRRLVLNENSYVGGMVTSRLGEAGRYNVAYGLDGLVRVLGDNYVTMSWAQTFDDSLSADPADASIARVTIERRAFAGFNYSAGITRAGPEFNPEMGFQRRRDFLNADGGVRYGWVLGDRSVFRTVASGLFVGAHFRNDDGSVESGGIAHVWGLQFKSDANLEVAAVLQREDLREPFSLSPGVVIPAGTYEERLLDIEYRASPGQLLRVSGQLVIGDFLDGRRVLLRVGPTWNVSPHLELEAEYQLTRITFPERGQEFDADLVRLRVQAALNTKASATAFVQYNSAGGLGIGNVRLRYNFAEGNDLYLVYNEVVNTDRDGLVPLPPRTGRRSLLFKYTYTFGL